MRLGPLHDSSLIARRFKVAGSPRYFAKFGKPKRIEDLTDHNCLAFTFRETRLARPWRFMQEGVEKSLTPNGGMSFSDGAAVCDAACAGYGLAQLQDYFADPAIVQGKARFGLGQIQADDRAGLARLSPDWPSNADGARLR